MCPIQWFSIDAFTPCLKEEKYPLISTLILIGGQILFITNFYLFFFANHVLAICNNFVAKPVTYVQKTYGTRELFGRREVQ